MSFEPAPVGRATSSALRLKVCGVRSKGAELAVDGVDQVVGRADCRVATVDGRVVCVDRRLSSLGLLVVRRGHLLLILSRDLRCRGQERLPVCAELRSIGTQTLNTFNGLACSSSLCSQFMRRSGHIPGSV